jgi:hypothetical protein
MTELPVACTLSDGELAGRRGGLLSDLRRHRQETRWLSDGVALRFPSGPSVIACVAEFIRLESPGFRRATDPPRWCPVGRGVNGHRAAGSAGRVSDAPATRSGVERIPLHR